MLVYICDDVEQDRMRLVHSLEKYSRTMEAEYGVSKVETDTFATADDLIRAFGSRKQKPDLIFLDIFMQRRDGMEAAKTLRKAGCTAGLIFVTTSDDHAIESYDVNARYYLKKPYTWEKFTAAMDKCRDIFLLNAACFTGSINRKKYSIPYHEILYFETSGHTVVVHSTSNEPASFYLSMKNLADMVKDYPGFTPVGKSYLVNMNYIKDMKDGILTLKDGTMIPVPVRCVKEVESAIQQYQKQN